jgi:hypothetical protein
LEHLNIRTQIHRFLLGISLVLQCLRGIDYQMDNQYTLFGLQTTNMCRSGKSVVLLNFGSRYGLLGRLCMILYYLLLDTRYRFRLGKDWAMLSHLGKSYPLDTHNIQ